ncbi:MAG: hemerythrin domain-containing protein [Myxococcota bacterium]
MNPLNHGLQYRMRRAARQMGEQHAQLAQILAELGPAITERRQGDARALFERYRDAIEAHFSLEEDVFFPALHGLHPEHASELELLGHEHAGLKAQIERLGGLLERDFAAFGAGVSALVQALANHEGREERLARALVGGSAPVD